MIEVEGCNAVNEESAATVDNFRKDTEESELMSKLKKAIKSVNFGDEHIDHKIYK